MDEIDDATAARIGRISIEAARLEGMASILFTTLIGNEVASVVSDGQPWSTVLHSCLVLIARREEIATNVGDWRFTRVFGEMRQTLTAAESLMQDRANVVHGFWFTGYAGDDLPGAHLSRRFRRPESRQWSAGQLDELRHSIRQAGIDIGDAIHSYLVAFGQPADA